MNIIKKTFSLGAASISVGTNAWLPNNSQEEKKKFWNTFKEAERRSWAAELGSVCPEILLPDIFDWACWIKPMPFVFFQFFYDNQL